MNSQSLVVEYVDVGGKLMKHQNTHEEKKNKTKYHTQSIDEEKAETVDHNCLNDKLHLDLKVTSHFCFIFRRVMQRSSLTEEQLL